MTLNTSRRRLVIEVSNADQVKAAAEAAKAYDGEATIRWVLPPKASNWQTGTTTVTVPTVLYQSQNGYISDTNVDNIKLTS